MSPGASSGGKVAMTKEQDIAIDEEFDSICRSLSDEELAGLTAAILRDGCTDPLIVWAGPNILLDGHNRFRICREHKLRYKVAFVTIPDREAAAIWIADRQLSKRNLSDLDRIDLARKREGYERAAAKARMAQAAGQPQGTKAESAMAKLPQQTTSPHGATRDRLGKIAGVSGNTYSRGVRILKKGVPEVIDAVRRQKISISQGARIVELPPAAQVVEVARGSSGHGDAIARAKKPTSIDEILDSCVLRMSGMLKTLLARSDINDVDPEHARTRLLPELTREDTGIRQMLKRLIDRIKEAAHEDKR